MSQRIDSREYFERVLVAKIWKDEAFKKEVLTNPNEAIRKVLEEREPDAQLPNVNIRVVEENAHQIYLIVPFEMETAKAEITEEDKKQLSRKGLEQLIASRASQDNEYKQKLQADPKAVLQSTLRELDPNLNLPDNLAVTLLEETEETAFLVVPPDPTAVTDEELTEEQLEAVAGGVAAVAVFVVAAVAVAVAGAAAAAVQVTAAVNINEAVNVHHVATVTKGGGESPW